jgi:transposase InsO family protein
MIVRYARCKVGVGCINSVAVTACVERGLAFCAAHGIEPKRLLSNNAFVYGKNRARKDLLERSSIQHRFIRARRPQTNGKVERFQQTLKREWGLDETYRTSAASTTSRGRTSSG